jgi:hypothetical protein
MPEIVIGPNFGMEIEAAGLTGLPFSWGPDGVFGVDKLSSADQASLQAVIAAHDPDKPEVPRAVTQLQCRTILRRQDMMTSVETWLATQDAATNEQWDYASVIERDSPVIAAAATALGLTSAQVDALFIAAAQV